MHAVLALVLAELLVVLRESDTKDHRSDAFEGVDPLGAVVALPTDVDHLELSLLQDPRDLDDARRHLSRM